MLRWLVKHLVKAGFYRLAGFVYAFSEPLGP